VPLGVSPIPVSEPPTSISDALPVLDSAADRLQRLDQILGARLEVEGGRLCRAVVENILTCFQSHDPAISLEPVIASPVADTEDAAREGIKDVVELVAERFQRDPSDDELPNLQREGKDPAGRWLVIFSGFVRYFWEVLILTVTKLICMLFAFSVCVCYQLLPSTWPPWYVGSTCQGWMPVYLRKIRDLDPRR
jgi:hypothetical protein